MRETRHFLNLVLAHFNLPLPEPLRSEVEEYFDFEDNLQYELIRLSTKSLSGPNFWEAFRSNDKLNLSSKEKARYAELRALYRKYKPHYFETEDDGYDDEMITRCIRNIRDEDSFMLDERQRQIAIELLELELFEIKRKERVFSSDVTPYLRKFALRELDFDFYDKEKRLKRRYLEMKYGRRERLRKEREEEVARKGRNIAACLG